MGSLIGNIKNGKVMEEVINCIAGLKYYFETPLCGYGSHDPILNFRPLPSSSMQYEFKYPLKHYIKIEELYEDTEEGLNGEQKYLNITYLQPFTNNSNHIINPYLFIYFDYLKHNLGISKIVFNINRDQIPHEEFMVYPGCIDYKKPVISLSDFQIHINNTGYNSDNQVSINLCNINELKNVSITSNTPHKSGLGGLRWRFAFSMSSKNLAYRDLYLNSDFIMGHKNNLHNHTNNIPGGIPISIDCDFENQFKFTDDTETGFLYNFFKKLDAIDKVNYPCLIQDFLPEDMVMNINNEYKYFLYMTKTSSKRFTTVEDEIQKLENMSSGGIKWKCYKDDKYFCGDLFYYKLFFGVSI